MAVSKSIHARKFYRVALQRLEDADILRRNKRLGASVYLAGYAVECMLKALVLEHSPAGQQKAVLQGFRGARGHRFDSLREEYQRCGAPPLPREIVGALIIVSRWDVELRYEPKSPPSKLVARFIAAARLTCQRAESRL